MSRHDTSSTDYKLWGNYQQSVPLLFFRYQHTCCIEISNCNWTGSFKNFTEFTDEGDIGYFNALSLAKK